MTVLEIIRDYLEENDFDGLAGDDCGCSIDDLVPCCCEFEDCKPAYKAIAIESDTDYCSAEVDDVIYITDKSRRVK